MKGYSPYLSDLRDLLTCQESGHDLDQAVELAVNGQASAKLESLVNRSLLKRSGAYFSSPALSRAVASSFRPQRGAKGLMAVDPACGAGNLLIAAARKLPVHRSLTATLDSWGRRLAGFDVHQEFIEAAHLRLALFALHLGARFDIGSPSRIARFFPHIRLGDGIRGLASLPPVGHLLLNPPFNWVLAPKECNWGTGRVSKAALFVTDCVKRVPLGTRISAILPDVLRAGSRYQRWREELEASATITRIRPMGNFLTADVDVFVVDFTVGGWPGGRAQGVHWWDERAEGPSVGDHFEVHVGPVVRHRLKRHHPLRLYLHAKGLPLFGKWASANETIRFDGPVVKPPFVVIRRTSSPSDRIRAGATVVSGHEALAVDNHLIICSPRHGSVGRCNQLIGVLKSKLTGDYLNRRIRCRHLTVGVVREIPWNG